MTLEDDLICAVDQLALTHVEFQPEFSFLRSCKFLKEQKNVFRRIPGIFFCRQSEFRIGENPFVRTERHNIWQYANLDAFEFKILALRFPKVFSVWRRRFVGD